MAFRIWVTSLIGGTERVESSGGTSALRSRAGVGIVRLRARPTGSCAARSIHVGGNADSTVGLATGCKRGIAEVPSWPGEFQPPEPSKTRRVAINLRSKQLFTYNTAFAPPGHKSTTFSDPACHRAVARPA